MIKLYTHVAEQMLIALHYVKDRTDSGAVAAFGKQVARYGEDRALSEAFQRHYGHGVLDGMPQDIEELCKVLLQQINAVYEGGDSGGDLIDVLVQTLQLPYSRNVIAGRTLHSLKTALLLPSELPNALGRLQVREQSCAGCGKALLSGMLMTLVNDGRGPAYYCTNCHQPTMVVCHDCGQAMGIDKRLSSAFSKSFNCGCASNKDTPKKMTPDTERGRLGVYGPAPQTPNWAVGGLLDEGAHLPQHAVPIDTRTGLPRTRRLTAVEELRAIAIAERHRQATAAQAQPTATLTAATRTQPEVIQTETGANWAEFVGADAGHVVNPPTEEEGGQ